MEGDVSTDVKQEVAEDEPDKKDSVDADPTFRLGGYGVTVQAVSENQFKLREKRPYIRVSRTTKKGQPGYYMKGAQPATRLNYTRRYIHRFKVDRRTRQRSETLPEPPVVKVKKKKGRPPKGRTFFMQTVTKIPLEIKKNSAQKTALPSSASAESAENKTDANLLREESEGGNVLSESATEKNEDDIDSQLITPISKKTMSKLKDTPVKTSKNTPASTGKKRGRPRRTPKIEVTSLSVNDLSNDVNAPTDSKESASVKNKIDKTDATSTPLLTTRARKVQPTPQTSIKSVSRKKNISETSSNILLPKSTPTYSGKKRGRPPKVKNKVPSTNVSNHDNEADISTSHSVTDSDLLNSPQGTVSRVTDSDPLNGPEGAVSCETGVSDNNNYMPTEQGITTSAPTSTTKKTTRKSQQSILPPVSGQAGLVDSNKSESRATPTTSGKRRGRPPKKKFPKRIVMDDAVQAVDSNEVVDQLGDDSYAVNNTQCNGSANIDQIDSCEKSEITTESVSTLTPSQSCIQVNGGLVDEKTPSAKGRKKSRAGRRKRALVFDIISDEESDRDETVIPADDKVVKKKGRASKRKRDLVDSHPTKRRAIQRSSRKTGAAGTGDDAEEGFQSPSNVITDAINSSEVENKDTGHPLETSQSEMDTPIKSRKTKAKVKVVCSHCEEKEEMSLLDLKKHLMSHHHRIWARNEPEGYFSPNQVYKHMKYLLCLKCGKRMNSMTVYNYHTAWCGKEDQTEKCAKCGMIVKSMWFKIHENRHRKEEVAQEQMKKKKEETVGEEIIDDLTGKPRRRAAKRALENMLDLADDLDGDRTENKTVVKTRKIRYICPAGHYPHRVMQQARLQHRKMKKVCCVFKGCDKWMNSLAELKEHLSMCDKSQTPANVTGLDYICLKCDKSADTEADMCAHCKTHQYTDESCSSGDDARDPAVKLAVSDVEDDDDDTDDDADMNDSYSDGESFDTDEEKPSKRSYTKVGSGGGGGARSCRMRHNLLEAMHSQTADWYREHEKPIYVNEAWQPETRHFTKVTSSDMKKYMPRIEKSPTFRIAGCTEKRSPQALSSFESIRHRNNNWTLNPGGPIWAMNWCPTPLTEANTQYLALYAHRHLDVKSEVAKMYTEPALLQIWTFNQMNDRTIAELPEMTLGLAMDSGPIWSIKWCPSGTHHLFKTESHEGGLRRIGLLMAGCANGSVHILSVPDPDDLKSSLSVMEDQSLPVYHIEPVALLQASVEPADSPVLCVDWGWQENCRHVAAGFADGTVCMWDLLTTSRLLVVKSDTSLTLLPRFTLSTHLGPVTCITMFSRNKHFISTCGFDRHIRYWDLRQPGLPHQGTQRGYMMCTVWPLLWNLIYCSSDNCYTLDKNSALMFDNGYYGYYQRPITNHKGSVWSISDSPWQNIIAAADSCGTIFTCPLPVMQVSCRQDKFMSKNRTILLGTVLEELSRDLNNETSDGVINNICSKCGKEIDTGVDGNTGKNLTCPKCIENRNNNTVSNTGHVEQSNSDLIAGNGQMKSSNRITDLMTGSDKQITSNCEKLCSGNASEKKTSQKVPDNTRHEDSVTSDAIKQSTTEKTDEAPQQKTSTADATRRPNISGTADVEPRPSTSGRADFAPQQSTFGGAPQPSTSGSADAAPQQSTSGSADAAPQQSTSGAAPQSSTSGSADAAPQQSTSGAAPQQSTSGMADAAPQPSISGTADSGPEQSTSGTADSASQQSTSGMADAAPQPSISGTADSGPEQSTSGTADSASQQSTSGMADAAPQQSTSGMADVETQPSISGTADAAPSTDINEEQPSASYTPRNWKSCQKYSQNKCLVFSDVKLGGTTDAGITKPTEAQDSEELDEPPLKAIYKVDWNPNLGCHGFLAAGGQAGLLRILYVPGEAREKLIKNLTSSITRKILSRSRIEKNVTQQTRQET